MLGLGKKMGKLLLKKERLLNTYDKMEKELAGLSQMSKVYNETPSFGNAATTLHEYTVIENDSELVKMQLARLEAILVAMQQSGGIKFGFDV